MKRNRIDEHPILENLTTTKKINFQFNGKRLTGYEHDTIASALLANGIRTLRHHEQSGNPRSFYCNIGHCFECRVTVNDMPNIRACITPIQEEMVIHSGKKQPSPLHPNNDTFPRTYREYKQLKDGEGE